MEGHVMVMLEVASLIQRRPEWRMVMLRRWTV